MSVTDPAVPTAPPRKSCWHCDRPELALSLTDLARLPSPGPETRLHEQLRERAVWLRGGREELLADPCLVAAAAALGRSLGDVTLAVARRLVEHRAAGDVCHHGVAVGERVCTTLTYRPDDADDRVGLVNVSDLLAADVSEARRASAELPVATDLLEARPDEPVMSLEEMDRLEDWDPRHCADLRPRRRWAHLVLVSHVWGAADRPTTEWRAIKARVNEWVDTQLARTPGERDARNKALSRDDYGVWVDFMMVPNAAHAEGAGDPCESCAVERRRMIQRIGALLTLATVLPMDDTAHHRGWILHELSLDAHGATRFEHRDRISLMAGDCEFTAVARHPGDPDDGRMLRCGEFVRLGQLPRVWPAVNDLLLDRLEAGGHADEGSPEAWAILTGLARGFDQECHDLKRLMAELTQRVALTPRPGDGGRTTAEGSFENPFDLSALSRAIDVQTRALATLDARILRAGPDVAGEEHALVSLDERRRLTGILQWQQFVCVAMGLRAEWLQEAGLAAWVRASAVTEALGGVKFLARLKDGRVRFSPARTITLRERPRSTPEALAYAREVATEGVSHDDLTAIYDVGARARQAFAAGPGPVPAGRSGPVGQSAAAVPSVTVTVCDEPEVSV